MNVPREPTDAKRKYKPDLLGSPLFVLSLIVLLVNDWYLKSVLHNDLTGKLSDFAGITLFALFGIAVFPRRALAVAGVTVVGFTYWKSPLSQSLIDGWNLLVGLPIRRTVDYSDLIALGVLPGVITYARREHFTSLRKPVAILLAGSALFAMMGTTRQPSVSEPLQRTRMERVSDYNYDEGDLKAADLRRLDRFLDRIPDNVQRAPVPNGLTPIFKNVVHYDLQQFAIEADVKPRSDFSRQSWLTLTRPTPTASRFDLRAKDPCDERLSRGAALRSVDPLLRVVVRYRRLPAESRTHDVWLELCDAPAKRSKADALRYFLEEVMPSVESQLPPRAQQ